MNQMPWPRLATTLFTATVVAASTFGLAACERRTPPAGEAPATTPPATTAPTTPPPAEMPASEPMPPASPASQ